MCYNKYICPTAAEKFVGFKDFCQTYLIGQRSAPRVKNQSAVCRWIAALLCAVMMIAFGACGENNSGSVDVTSASAPAAEPLGSGEIYVCFSASDSLDPYSAETSANQQLASLLFDPLVRLSPTLEPEFRLAESVKLNGRDVVITLRDAVFSDGSAVTASDVIYSLGRAKKAKNRVYTDQLKIITDYSERSEKEISLRLRRPDPLIANVLDFPILKEGSTSRRNDDDKALPPIGCGRYVYSDNSGTYTLTGNKNYYGKTPANTITLNNTPDREALQYSVRAGEVDIYYSGVMTGELLSMSGRTGTVIHPNIVFLGLDYTGIFADKDLRCAVSAMIGRREICSSAYYNYATSAHGLFPDKTSPAESIAGNAGDAFSEEPDQKAATEFLKRAGYSGKNADGYYTNSKRGILELELLYNRENVYQKNAAQILAKQLKNCGVSVSLDDRSAGNYKTAVMNRDYDLYIGEIKLSKDFDYTVMLSGEIVAGKTIAPTTLPTTAKTTAKPRETDEDGDPVYRDEATTASTTSAPKKEKKNENMSAAYANYLSGKLTYQKFLSKFKVEMPFVPIAFRSGVVSYNSNLSLEAVSTISDAYYNIEYLTVKK